MQMDFSSPGLSAAATAAPPWLSDIESQILVRNAVELKPSQLIFNSYATLHASALHLQTVEEERQTLLMRESELRARVHELERSAANSSMQSSRERELEAKKDVLQDQLQLYMQRESEFYKGLAEMKAVKEEREELRRRGGQLSAELEQRTAELQLLHKEYTSLRDEYDHVRLTVTEAERHRREAKSAAEKIAQLQYQILTLEAEVSMLRQRLQAASRGEAEGAGSMTEDARAAAGEDGEDAALTSRSAHRASSLHNDPCTSFSPPYISAEPSRISSIIADAHSGSSLHGLCVLDDGKHFLTSGTDKRIRLWNRLSGQAEKQFSSNSIALSLATSSHYLLAGCADHVVRFWDVNSLRVLEMAGHTEKVVAACLSSSAQYAFTASSDSTIKLWDVRRREALRTLLCQSTCNDVTVAGDTVFSAHYNGKITVWDRRTAARSGEAVAHQRVATCVRVSANGQLCVSLGKDNTISVRDARIFTRALFSVAPERLSVSMNWARLAISPSGQLCAVGSGRASELLLVGLDGRGGSAGGGDSTASAKAVRALLASKPSAAEDGGGGVGGGSGGRAPIFSTAWGASEGGPLVSISDDRSVQVWE